MLSVEFLSAAMNVLLLAALIFFAVAICSKAEGRPFRKSAMIGFAALLLTIICAIEYSKYRIFIKF